MPAHRHHGPVRARPRRARRERCCACGEPGAIHWKHLPYRRPADLSIPTFLWGCETCGIPTQGVMAIVCATCEREGREPVEGILGLPHSGMRMPLAGLEPFGHDLDRHDLPESMKCVDCQSLLEEICFCHTCMGFFAWGHRTGCPKGQEHAHHQLQRITAESPVSPCCGCGSAVLRSPLHDDDYLCACCTLVWRPS